MGGRTRALTLCLCLLGAGPLTAAPPGSQPPAARQAVQSDGSLQEVDVVGEQPGPGLWKISKGDHVLWLLGTLDHVPKGMTWRSRQVQSALASSQQLLANAPSVSAPLNPILLFRLYLQWRGLQKDPDRTRLRDWLPAPLYARFELLKARYDPHDGRIEELRPPFAALRLYQRSLDAAGLTRGNEIEHAVLELAHRDHVRVVRATVRVADPLGTLKQVRALSPALEVDCLATTIRRLETDLPIMQARAHAWAVGDIAQLRALPYPDQMEACVTALSAAPDVRALVQSASQAWMDAAESALNSYRQSFAIRPIYELLAPGGPLARFRAEGYAVEDPK